MNQRILEIRVPRLPLISTILIEGIAENFRFLLAGRRTREGRGRLAKIRARPCALPPALPFPLASFLRPSAVPPFSRSLSPPPRTSPSSVLRRARPHRTRAAQWFSAGTSRDASLRGGRAQFKVSCVREISSAARPIVSRAGELVNYPNDQDSPRGRRGLVDNWRQAGKLPPFRYIIRTRAAASRHANSGPRMKSPAVLERRRIRLRLPLIKRVPSTYFAGALRSRHFDCSEYPKNRGRCWHLAREDSCLSARFSVH